MDGRLATAGCTRARNELITSPRRCLYLNDRRPTTIQWLMIGFDARLISALGIGRYINGLLPPLSDILQGRLLVVSRRGDLALVRALTEGKATLITSDAAPYRLVEQSAFLLTLLRARLDLVHFPHYNLPVAYPRRFVVTIHDLFSFRLDRKSTRLNSSHRCISYAVFCLKKKK